MQVVRGNFMKAKVASGGNQSVYSTNSGQSVGNSVTQRVMSAKMLRVKQLQNQLSETQNQLNELVSENRLLRTLQKRQAAALQRFEGSQDQLPQLIRSHNEEIRVLTSKLKQLKEKYADLEGKLKRRDVEYNNLKEHHKHLLKLSQDKQLIDREKLTKRVEIFEQREKEFIEKIQLLNRKLELEGKNYRHQLNAESSKLKETQNDLKSALGTINSLKAALEAKDKYVNSNVPKKYSQSVEQLMQHTHVSLPIPPRVSIRQPQKFNVENHNSNEMETSTDSDLSCGNNYNNENHKDSDSSSGQKDEDQGASGKEDYWTLPKQPFRSNSNGAIRRDGFSKLRLIQSDDSLEDGPDETGDKLKRRLFSKLNRNSPDDRESQNNAVENSLKQHSRFRVRQLAPFDKKHVLTKPRSQSSVRSDLSTVKTTKSKRSLSGSNATVTQRSVENLTSPPSDNVSSAQMLETFHYDIKKEVDKIIDEDAVLEGAKSSKSLGKSELDKYAAMSWEEFQEGFCANKSETIEHISNSDSGFSGLSPTEPLNSHQKSKLLKMLNEIDDEDNTATGRDSKTFQDNEAYSELFGTDLDDLETSKSNLMKELFG